MILKKTNNSNYNIKEKTNKEKINTLRLSDSATETIYLIAKEENKTRSDVIRMLLDKSIREYKLKKALDLYEKGEIDFSTGAKVADISVHDFMEELRISGVGLQIPLEMTEYGFNSMVKLFGGKPIKLKKK